MYDYQKEKPKIFTEENQEKFLIVRDNAKKLMKESGAATMEYLLTTVDGVEFLNMAFVDRLVEIDELREVKQKDCFGQHRIFTSI